MPDVAVGAALTPMEHFLNLVAQAVRGDAPSPTSVRGQDIDLSPRMQPPTRPGAPWRPQTRGALLSKPPVSSGQLPRGSAPGLFEQAMLATQGALGLGNMDAGDYSSLEGQQTATRATGTGELLQLLAPLMAGGVATIKAFHGSPHDFEKFDFSKIGTGEGSQVYGHGGYFAEHPTVAKTYKELAPKVTETATGRHELPEILKYADPVRDRDMFERVLQRQHDQLSEWAASGMDQQSYMQGAVADSKRIIEAIDGALAGAPITSAGHTYEVNIHADPAEMLDWDVPLSEQQPAVQARVRAVLDARYGAGTFDQMAKQGSDVRDIVGHFDDLPEGGMEGLLHQQGIPGIRYLDQGSRGAQMADRWTVTNHADDGHAINSLVFPSEAEATAYLKSREYAKQAKQFGYATSKVDLTPAKADVTRNYVMFPGTEHLIEIAKKYGVALPVAAEIFRRQQAQQP